MNIPIKRLRDDAKLPTQARKGDGGWDLYALEPWVLHSGERHLFKTGLAMAIPYGWRGVIMDRSGMALNGGITKIAGLIDCGYRGDVGVLLINLGDSPKTINAGDKIAQIAFQAVPEVEWNEVDVLSKSERGEGGFGSSGT